MPELESFGSIPRALAAVILLFTAGYAVGARIVPYQSSPKRRPLDRHLLRIIVGLNLVGFLGIVLGLLELLPGMRSVWLLVALSLLSIPTVRSRRLRRDTAPARQIARSPLRPSRVGLIALVLLLTLVTLAPALCPPCGWDELVYHEVLPQRWQADGGPTFYSDLPYSGFPSMGEVLFWLTAPLENVIAPRLLSWMCWILGLVCLYQLLRRYLGVAPATLLTLVFPLNETMLLISENCYVETIVMMNVAATLLAIGTSREGSEGWNWRRPVLLGALAGGTAAVKLTGCALVVVPCMWYLAEAYHDRSRRTVNARGLATCLLTAFVVASPFYLRPLLATGNPFYPFFCQWFTTDPAALEMSRHHHLIGGFGFGVKSIAAFVDGPLLLAFRSDNYDGRFGWQLLGFIGLAIIGLVSARRRRIRHVVLWPAAVAAWFYVFWFATAQQARFAVPAALAFVILAGLGLHRLRRAWRRVTLLSLVVAALASTPWERTGYYWYSVLAVVGRVSRVDYVHNMTDRIYLPLVQAIDVVTPRDAKLMLLYEHRGFYMPRPYVIGTPLFQEAPFTPPERYNQPDHILDVLRRGKITHVVMPKASIGPDQTNEWFDRQKPFVAGIDKCLQHGLLRPVWESEIYLLLEVRSETVGVDTGPDRRLP